MTTGTNDITELRGHLFETLRGLKDKTIDIDRAKAIADTAQTIINSSKVEVEYIKATGKASGSGFIPPVAPKGGATVIEERPGVRVTQHKLKG